MEQKYKCIHTVGKMALPEQVISETGRSCDNHVTCMCRCRRRGQGVSTSECGLMKACLSSFAD